ncbi:hypothetical protein GCM10010244_07640 [Streptomyces coeruleorubidus]|nr:hypothetical protein GCM10010244_07640 [Streptomyces bellus]
MSGRKAVIVRQAAARKTAMPWSAPGHRATGRKVMVAARPLRGGPPGRKGAGPLGRKTVIVR